MKKKTIASLADINELYEQSVQSPEAEIEFINRTYKSIFKHFPRIFREDFAGTSLLSTMWVQESKLNKAIAVDLDKDVLEWASNRNLSKLSEMERARIRFINEDVVKVKTSPIDVIGAFNFSYWVFKSRDMLLTYFKSCFNQLDSEGLLLLDAFGGSDAYVEQKERTKHKEFTYVWYQSCFKPVTNELLCHIEFEFPDGSSLPKVFTYDWRLWTLPEIKELLLEAGFQTAQVYWEREDKKGEGTGYFKEEASGVNDTAWVVYLVAKKES